MSGDDLASSLWTKKQSASFGSSSRISWHLSLCFSPFLSPLRWGQWSSRCASSAWNQLPASPPASASTRTRGRKGDIDGMDSIKHIVHRPLFYQDIILTCFLQKQGKSLVSSLYFSFLTSRSKTSERLENFLLINLTKARLISSLIIVWLPIWEGDCG